MYHWRIGSTYVRTSILLALIWAATFAGALGHAAAPTALTAAHAIYLPLIQQALAGRLVFTATQNGTSKIVTMYANGTGRTRLSDLTANDFEPTWSPDGAQIVFASDRNGGGIYLMRVDGTHLRLLLAKPLEDDFAVSAGPVWSPDGSHIVVGFTRHNEARGDLYVLQVAGTTPPTVIHEPAAILDSFAWSPDSKQIAFATGYLEDSLGGSIYLMHADGTARQLLRSFDAPTPYDLAWSPDGRHILYTGGQDLFTDNTRDIYVMGADGAAPQQLTNNAGFNFGAAWSPDGRYIAFSSSRLRTGQSSLFVMNADGSEQTPMVGSIAGDSSPAWHS
jgi:Tol biopolymer transport system component